MGSWHRKEELNNELTPTGVTVGFAGGSGRRGLRPLVWMGGGDRPWVIAKLLLQADHGAVHRAPSHMGTLCMSFPAESLNWGKS